MPARSSRVRLQVQPSLLTKRKRPSCTERGPRSNGKTAKGWLCYAGRCLTGKWSRERDSNPQPARYGSAEACPTSPLATPTRPHREVTPARRCLDQMRPAVLEYYPHVHPHREGRIGEMTDRNPQT